MRQGDTKFARICLTLSVICLVEFQCAKNKNYCTLLLIKDFQKTVSKQENGEAGRNFDCELEE